MDSRFWVLLGARLLGVLVLVLWAVSYFVGDNGEKEFKKTLQAMKQVRSFRAAYVGHMTGTQTSETSWEVDCNRGILRRSDHTLETSTNPPAEMRSDQLLVAGKKYVRKDESWSPNGFAPEAYSSKWYCVNLAQGTNTNLFPDIATMIQRAILEKGDKKTVNGVRCREWLITMKMGGPEIEHNTVCIGLDDHLPYEMNADYNRAHYSFSDYNTAIPFDLPDAALQPVNAGDGAN